MEDRMSRVRIKLKTPATISELEEYRKHKMSRDIHNQKDLMINLVCRI